MEKNDTASCFFCGSPCQRLCDYVLGFEHVATTVYREGKKVIAKRVRSLGSAMFTCDLPLCVSCTTVAGRSFVCSRGGKKSGCVVDTEDICEVHKDMHGKYTGPVRILTKEEADVLRQDQITSWLKRRKRTDI